MAMDGLYADNAGAVVGDAMDGLYADNAGRLHGCRRYASMDGCGRTASGTAVESNAGAVAEQLSAMPWMACMPTTQDDCTDAGGTHPWMDAVERRRE